MELAGSPRWPNAAATFDLRGANTAPNAQPRLYAASLLQLLFLLAAGYQFVANTIY